MELADFSAAGSFPLSQLILILSYSVVSPFFVFPFFELHFLQQRIKIRCAFLFFVLPFYDFFKGYLVSEAPSFPLYFNRAIPLLLLPYSGLHDPPAGT